MSGLIDWELGEFGNLQNEWLRVSANERRMVLVYACMGI